MKYLFSSAKIARKAEFHCFMVSLVVCLTFFPTERKPFASKETSKELLARSSGGFQLWLAFLLGTGHQRADPQK
jgi:hypothetical protein